VSGNRHARADRVAGPEERPEVGLKRDPQGGNEEVVPAAVPALAATATDIAGPGLCGAQRARASALSSFMPPQYLPDADGSLNGGS